MKKVGVGKANDYNSNPSTSHIFWNEICNKMRMKNVMCREIQYRKQNICGNGKCYMKYVLENIRQIFLWTLFYERQVYEKQIPIFSVRDARTRSKHYFCQRSFHLSFLWCLRLKICAPTYFKNVRAFRIKYQ